MRIKKVFAVVLMLAVCLVGLPLPASAQLNSTVSTVALNVSIGESITLNCSPASVNFSSGASPMVASAPISCTTSWTLAGTRSSVTLYQYFLVNSVLGVGSAGVTAASFSSSVDGGAQSAFASSQSTPGGTGTAMPNAYYGPNLFTLNLSTTFVGSRTDTSLLQLFAPTLGAGSYSGTLNFEAQAI